MDKPELFQAWVGGIVRHLLAGVTGYFVAHGIITGDTGAATIAAATVFLGNLAWGLYQKYLAAKLAAFGQPLPKDPTSGAQLRSIAIFALILALTLPYAACAKQTTLDRIGSVLTVAVRGYQTQLDSLHAQSLIDDAKYARLTAKNAAIQKQVDALATVISGFGQISAGDVPSILQHIDAVAGVVESSLTDAAWSGTNANVDALRALRWIRATLSTTALVVAALFPPAPKPTPSTATLSRDIPVRTGKAVTTSKVKIDLPKL